MPHLSPMNWTLALVLSWTSIMVLMSSNWWKQTNLFIPLNLKKNTILFNSWQWL